MEVRATAKVKIKASPEIIKTIKVYKKGLQFCINQAWKRKINNNIKLHPFVYPSLRKRGLQSQLAIACIKQACGMVKKAKSKPIINKTSMRYNFPRSASFKNNMLSLATIKGRIKIPFNVPDCYKQYFSWNIKESLLRIDKKGRCFFLFCFAKDIKAKGSNFQNRVLGIDVGINNIAVTSDRIFFNAKQIKQKRIRFQRLRKRLQAKGTHSSKRLLKKIAGREKRFMAYWNHKISKEIVNCDAGTIIMENLKGIRKVRRGRKLNFWLNGWSFYQLQEFIKYKAERKGIKVIRVSPYLTSQACSNCGNIGFRSKGFFICSHCNYSLNADLNASYNLAKHNSKSDGVLASVTMPYIQANEHKGSIATECEAMDKYPLL
nr:IS200/IS605 family element transposase accessory protein TnpB [Candidatus Woesearchaeota archaeon]